MYLLNDVGKECKFLIEGHKWHATINKFLGNGVLIKGPQIKVLFESANVKERGREYFERLTIFFFFI